MYKSGRVAIANVVPDPGQPRKLFRPGELTALSENLTKVGQQVPVIVYQDGDKFVLLDGERRFRAAKLAGFTELAAIMLTERPSKAQLRVLQNSLDAHREQLTPMERSNLLAEIQQESGWCVSDLAERLSMKQSLASKLLAFQRLAPEIQTMLQTSSIDMERAYILSQVTDFAEQLQLLKTSASLSRDQLRAKVKDNGQGAKAKRAVFQLPGGTSVTVGGNESTLDQVIESLTSVLKELRRGLSQGLDIVTAQRVLKDKAKVKS
jgi:ParB family transcriptional regulator, chromosome partitioning protein